ncbi:MAG: OsmC family protein [Bacillota bacterium]|nr:OsmC family protein [Bacillota bacterium]
MGPIAVEWTGGMAFVGRNGEGHRISMDAAPAVGGGGAAPRPTELVLIALGGCTGMDVVSILRKMQQPLESLAMTIEADRAGEHPKVFTAVRLLYRLTGQGLDPAKVRRAIDLSLSKYCTVGNMLNKTAAISYQVEINGERLP